HRALLYLQWRRHRGARGRRLMRPRVDRFERSFAYRYDTGGMGGTHLRGHENILKRLLIHAGGFNLGLLLRSMLGVGTPRGLQGRLAAIMLALIAVARRRFGDTRMIRSVMTAMRGLVALQTKLVVNSSASATCTTGS